MDRLAVVTGASRGIGRAVAIELARARLRRRGDDARSRRRRRPRDGRSRVERLDVTDPATIDLPDGLRVLVNNAGVESDNLPLEVMPADAWRTIFETNVFGLVEVTKRAVPLMRAAGGGVICNVTSSSMLAPVPFLGAYRAIKAAVTAIGESLAAEVAQFGIRVVEVMPGPIETDMLATSDQPAAAIEHAAVPRARREDVGGPPGRSARRTRPRPKRRAASSTRSCDDDGPLRYGCDDLSEGMLAGLEQRPTTTRGCAACSRSFSMITGLAHTALHVADVDAAVAWYRDVLGLTVLSPPYRMEGDAITRDMGELVPAPVVVKAAIVGVDDGADRVIEVIEYPNGRAAPPAPTRRCSRSASRTSRCCATTSPRPAPSSRRKGVRVPRRRRRRRRRAAHHLVRRPVGQRLHPRREAGPSRPPVLPPVLNRYSTAPDACSSSIAVASSPSTSRSTQSLSWPSVGPARSYPDGESRRRKPLRS